MFTGSVYFKLTPNGYVVHDFVKGSWWNRTRIGGLWNSIGYLNIEGTFNFKPVKGQFCKKPHKLIVWSK